MLDAGCWVLGAGCWVLGAGCWVLGAGCWVLGCWMLGCWMLDAEVDKSQKGGEIMAGGMRSYRDLEIWRMSRELAAVVHQMTLEKLPKFEMYEEGSQIRRSSKSISINIVEGYGRRRYRNDYIKFLTYALASCDETREHLEMIFETGSLADQEIYQDLHHRYDILGRKINNFLQTVIAGHFAPKDQIGQQIYRDTAE